MTSVLWVGFGLVLLLVLFLMTAFFAAAKMTHGQKLILRFLCALCAGLAGGLITGDALFKAEEIGLGAGGKFAVSGSAGFALFFVVFFAFNFFTGTDSDSTETINEVSFSVPANWKFEDAVRNLLSTEQLIPEFVAFTPEQLNATLKAATMRGASVEILVAKLGSLVKAAGFPAYDTKRDGPTLKITARS